MKAYLFAACWLVALGALCADAAQAQPERAFKLWAAQNGKSYENDEERDKRQTVFQQNAHYIASYIAANPATQMALNEFADMTWDEFSATRLGFRGEEALRLKEERLAASNGHTPFRYADVTPAGSIDWRDHNAVTEVKNQGQCGSCWSFATTGAIEGVNALASGQLVALSEQQLVDCDTEKDMGCGGGLMDYAYQYVIKNGGLDTEEDYSYWSGWGVSLWGCNRRKEHDRTVVTIDGFEDVPTDEESLLKAASKQPISVGICASAAMQFYAGGVLDKCCDELNHGVLVAGYGNEKDGTPYWLVKNSWGGGWGDSGYFKLKRGVSRTGLCGIATAASYPVKTSPNPAVPEMCDLFGWTECPAKQTCSCSFSLLGWICLWHDCCPLEGGVTCEDLQHCCPANAPVCNTQAGTCTSEDGAVSVPWSPKAKAQVLKGAPTAPTSDYLAPFLRTTNRAEPGPQAPTVVHAPGETAAQTAARERSEEAAERTQADEAEAEAEAQAQAAPEAEADDVLTTSVSGQAVQQQERAWARVGQHLRQQKTKRAVLPA